MQPRKRAVVHATVLLALTSASVSAQVSGGGPPNGGVGNDIFNDTRSAAGFSVGPLGFTFDAIRFWGIVPGSSAYSPDIFWQILLDVGGSPDDGSVVASGDALATPSAPSPLIGFPGNTTWQFDFSTGLQSLGSSVFWLALHDGPVDPTGSLTTSPDLIWETTAGGTAFQSESISAGTGWAQFGDGSLAFELESSSSVTSTPEPASLVLLATGLVGVAVFRARRRKTLVVIAALTFTLQACQSDSPSSPSRGHAAGVQSGSAQDRVALQAAIADASARLAPSIEQGATDRELSGALQLIADAVDRSDWTDLQQALDGADGALTKLEAANDESIQADIGAIRLSLSEAARLLPSSLAPIPSLTSERP